jgi:hypothetical protein
MDEIHADRSLQCRTQTLALTDTSAVLRRFDHDTKLLTIVVLSALLIAAAVLGSEELVQTKFARLNAWSPSNAVSSVVLFCCPGIRDESGSHQQHWRANDWRDNDLALVGHRFIFP